MTDGDGARQAFSVSIVLTGRNDDHGTDFRTRCFRTLRFNHRELTARGICHEFVFVEWAPPPDRARLIDLVFDAVPELDPDAVAWYLVDRRYQDALSHNSRLHYLEFAAKNVGVRRARHRFVLSSNCDVYLGRHTLDAFERGALEPGIVYRAPRHDLKLSTDHSNLTWDVLEDPRNMDGQAHPLRPPLMNGGTGDFILLDRDSFHEIRGFNEVYRAARIGVDFNFLIKVLSAGLTIRDIGGPVYHVNHGGSYRLSRDAYAGREAEAPWGDSRWHARGVVYINPTTWGLSEAPVRCERDRCWHLDFAWDAVPPLVDLRRVVLPVSRTGGPARELHAPTS